VDQGKIAYSISACQNSTNQDTCNADSANRINVSIKEYYQGDACATIDPKTSGSLKVVDCLQGCAKINSAVTDRGADLSRTTRQCAFYDKDIVGKYIDSPGFKRTGAGSDKVANWFFYCSKHDLCNSASGVSSFSAIMIASFYGVLAFLYQ
jgi:hypothetical protein